VSVALLPYIHATYNRLSRLLSKHNIKSVALPPKKCRASSSISCECEFVYIGQMGRSTEIRIKEHQRNIRLLQLDKSALVEHGFNHNHKLLLQDVEILSTKSGYLDRLIMEAIEVAQHPNNINRKDGLILSECWKPIIQLLERKQLLSFSAPQSHPVKCSSTCSSEFGSPSSHPVLFYLCGYKP
jgi:hypothetical protein